VYISLVLNTLLNKHPRSQRAQHPNIAIVWHRSFSDLQRQWQFRLIARFAKQDELHTKVVKDNLPPKSGITPVIRATHTSQNPIQCLSPLQGQVVHCIAAVWVGIQVAAACLQNDKQSWYTDFGVSM
jgi:hypothetical protein